MGSFEIVFGDPFYYRGYCSFTCYSLLFVTKQTSRKFITLFDTQLVKQYKANHVVI